MKWSGDEVMFYLGIAAVAASTAGALACLILLKIKWMRLSSKLDEEYGKEQNGRLCRK